MENTIEDLKIAERDCLLNMHWTLDQYEQADYFALNEILSAKDKKDRVVDPMSLIGGG
ncbi:hypothetical protein LOOC260_114180 [Paucilactobacillus hokkaidonensis JCM 18461]|uniref:Uncharacterized protein n=1 Tax=Paucilactobacillus hokkaidonensis JCM 18461 TaxID=1291742 RepID=A0A0A1GYF3_9LACO|nr:hypothetical protein [Paucilactobacillus hokkaidonensis]BAP85954.1 hypothetical protein LOOC260_114180 [Paucilactobacillus hokkaidonensis JCM 18461]